MFCTGELAKKIWRLFEVSLGKTAMVLTLRHMVLLLWLQRGVNPYLKFVYQLLPLLVCLELCKARNGGIFDGRRVRFEEVADQILATFA